MESDTITRLVTEVFLLQQLSLALGIVVRGGSGIVSARDYHAVINRWPGLPVHRRPSVRSCRLRALTIAEMQGSWRNSSRSMLCCLQSLGWGLHLCWYSTLKLRLVMHVTCKLCFLVGASVVHKRSSLCWLCVCRPVTYEKAGASCGSSSSSGHISVVPSVSPPEVALVGEELKVDLPQLELLVVHDVLCPGFTFHEY